METKVDNYFSPLNEEEQRLRLKKKKWAQIRKNRALYIMVLPGILYFLIFRYIPMGGLVIAFQDYQPFLGDPRKPLCWLHPFYSALYRRYLRDVDAQYIDHVLLKYHDFLPFSYSIGTYAK